MLVEGEKAIVAGGATSFDVAEAADHFGLAPVTGNIGKVGIAGLTLTALPSGTESERIRISEA